MPKPDLPLFETNPAEIEALLEYLRQAFQAYLNSHDTSYSDAFMAVHNFHKLVVQDLIDERGQPKELVYIAANIFNQTMHRVYPEAWAIDGLPMDLKSYPKKGKADEGK